MFDGLNNNRVHWKELADIYQAKVDAVENERKRLEEEQAKKGTLDPLADFFSFFFIDRNINRKGHDEGNGSHYTLRKTMQKLSLGWYTFVPYLLQKGA